jgi:hypothetical protein
METEVFTEGALLDLSDQLVGKPIVIFKDGKKRQVGVIRSASYGNGDISISGEVTDEDVAGFLNAETQRLSVPVPA